MWRQFLQKLEEVASGNGPHRLETDFSSSAGAGRSCALRVKVANPSFVQCEAEEGRQKKFEHCFILVTVSDALVTFLESG